MNSAIEINDLHFTYPDGRMALNGVNLTVAEGESLGLIGDNGSGKSTLLLHLNGILKGEGDIKIFGEEVASKNLSNIRKNVGLVFQDPDDQLFMPTVFEDVAFGPINLGMSKQDVNVAVERALSQVDMLHARDRTPHHLSLGEKKRVSIATVLSMTPKLLVLDEPSSNLDPRHRESLIALINTLPYTKIIATHDLDLVKRCCSRVVEINGGRLEAGG